MGGSGNIVFKFFRFMEDREGLVYDFGDVCSSFGIGRYNRSASKGFLGFVLEEVIPRDLFGTVYLVRHD